MIIDDNADNDKYNDDYDGEHKDDNKADDANELEIIKVVKIKDYKIEKSINNDNV